MKPNFLTALTKVKHKLLGKDQEDTLQSFIAKTAAGGIGIKVINLVLIYGMNLLLTRILGAEGYGNYAYPIAWVKLLTVPAALGFAGLTTRQLSVYQKQSQWGLMKGLIRWTTKIASLTSFVLASIFTYIIWQWTPTSDSMVAVLGIAMISLPFMVLARLRQSAMNALKRIIVGYLPESLIQPIIIICLLVCSVIFWQNQFNVIWAMGIYTLANGVAFLVGNRLLDQALPKTSKQALPEYQTKVWFYSALPMLFIGSMNIINNQTDTIMLGILKGGEDVGLYAVANRIAAIISFVIVAFNTSLGATFASIYAEGNKRKLQQVVTKGCQMVLLVSLPIFLLFLIFSNQILGLFGSDFVQAETTLKILSLGKLISTFTGSVALLLLMTNHEKEAAIGVSTSAMFNIILNRLLIPQWGPEGAAIATASSTALWNMILAIFAYKRLGINSTIFGKT